ncbi:MAG TPA: phosphotransferase [Coriobacteriia bacterium]
MCFVFESLAAEPTLVVKAMPEARYAGRLRHETEIVESIRRRLGPSSPAAAALPLAALFAGTAADDYVVVQPVDPLAGNTGRIDDRAAALAWLRSFQEGTAITTRAWEDADTAAALDSVRYAWRRERSVSAEAIIAQVDGLLQALEGQLVRRCAVHGDFWRGNIARGDGELRVYDWEWAEEQGTPFFDLWTFELGVLRKKAEDGECDLRQPLVEAVARVSAELEAQGLHRGFALATLAPSLARLVFRVRRATGLPGGAEAESVRLMAAVEGLLPESAGAHVS